MSYIHIYMYTYIYIISSSNWRSLLVELEGMLSTGPTPYMGKVHQWLKKKKKFVTKKLIGCLTSLQIMKNLCRPILGSGTFFNPNI